MQQPLTNTGVTNVTSPNYVPPLIVFPISINGINRILPLTEVKNLERSLISHSLFQQEQEEVNAITFNLYAVMEVLIPYSVLELQFFWLYRLTWCFLYVCHFISRRRGPFNISCQESVGMNSLSFCFVWESLPFSYLRGNLAPCIILGWQFLCFTGFDRSFHS